MDLQKQIKEQDYKFLVDVKVSYKDYKKEYEKVKQDFVAHAQLPGFRKGKVAPAIIEKRYSASIEKGAVENVINDSYKKIHAQENLKVFGNPVVESLEKVEQDKEIQFTFSLHKYPSLDTEIFDGITIEEEQSKVEEKDVDEEIKNYQKQQSEFKEEEIPFAIGCRCFCSMETSNEDEEVKKFFPMKKVPYDASNFENEKDAKDFGFFHIGDQIFGMKKGEEKTITKKMPKDFYVPALKDKNLTVTVKVNQVEKLYLIEMNEEMLKKIGFSSVNEMKENIKLRMQENFENHKKEIRKKRFLKNLREKNTFKISDQFYQMVIENKIKEDGKFAESFEKEDFKKNYISQIQLEMENSLLLEKILEKFPVEVTSEKIEEVIQKISDVYKQDYKEIRKKMLKDGTYTKIKQDLKTDLALENLYQKNKFTKGKDLPLKAFLMLQE